MSAQAAARVSDPFGHTMALDGALAGLAIGALAGVLIVATGGLGAIAVGAAIATAGGMGMMGESIGQTIQGSPSGGLLQGSSNAFINGLPATMVARGQGACSIIGHGPGRAVASGVPNVLINGLPVARVGDKMDCSAVILSGSPNVIIGGNSQQFLPITPEVPTLLNAAMATMAIGGTLLTTAGMAAAYGLSAAVGGLIAGAGGAYIGEKAARAGAKALGFGETGQAIASAAGGLIGGFGGGKAGWSGGNALATEAALAKMPPDFQSEYAAAKVANWRKPDGKDWWPPNDGGIGAGELVTLPPGTPVDRYGNELGRFMSDVGVPFYDRAMPGARRGDPDNYVVTGEGLLVKKSPIAPWYDRPGGGTQYELVNPNDPGTKYSVENAIEDGYLDRE